MKKTIFFITIILVVIVATISSCTKVEDEIIGKWKSEQMLVEPANTITWEFKSDGSLIRTLIKNDGSIVDDCTFSFEKKLTQKYIRINGSEMLPGLPHINGLWRVESFKDDVMSLRRVEMNDGDEAPYLYREFTRLN